MKELLSALSPLVKGTNSINCNGQPLPLKHSLQTKKSSNTWLSLREKKTTRLKLHPLKKNRWIVWILWIFFKRQCVTLHLVPKDKVEYVNSVESSALFCKKSCVLISTCLMTKQNNERISSGVLFCHAANIARFVLDECCCCFFLIKFRKASGVFLWHNKVMKGSALGKFEYIWIENHMQCILGSKSYQIPFDKHSYIFFQWGHWQNRNWLESQRGRKQIKTWWAMLSFLNHFYIHRRWGSTSPVPSYSLADYKSS